MICFPNAKINLGLNIISKREDGFHNLETIFIPVPLKDSLEIIKSDSQTFVLHPFGKKMEGNLKDNLLYKAWEILHINHQIPSVEVSILKNIPMGGGVGGGSSNAAFMLRLLNDYFSLNLTTNKLMDYALILGSDVPFFILNTPQFARGRGEVFEPVSIDFQGNNFITMVFPNIHVSTKEAFQGILPERPQYSLKELINQPMINWKNSIQNDFEKSVFKKFPEIELVKDSLYKNGASFSALTGTGSCVYGFSPKSLDLQNSKKWEIFEFDLNS